MTDDPPAESSAPAPAAAAEPSPARVLGAKRALGIFAAFLGVQLAVAIVVGVYAGYANARRAAGVPGEGLQIDPRVTMGAAFVGTLLAGLAVLRMLRRTFPGALGSGALASVGWAPASTRACGRAALQGVALVGAIVLLAGVFPAPRHALGPLASAAQLGGWSRVAWAVLAFACAPPVEELVFRGVLYTGLARAWRPAAAGAVTTAIFVALHVTEIGTYWPAWIGIASLGVLALRARVATGSLLPAVALHASYNLGLVLAVYAQQARAS